ncbi:hypothetical protein BH09VER1_BH09VER1_26180 [soil metagenome]
MFSSPALAALYEESRPFCHPEHPFLDPHYSTGGYYPFTDFTMFLAQWLKAGDFKSVHELWSFLTRNDVAERYLLTRCLGVSVSPLFGLDEESALEAKAIYILSSRQSLYDHNSGSVAMLSGYLLASRLASISWLPPEEIRTALIDSAAKEANVEEGPGIKARRREKAEHALNCLLEPISAAAANAGQWLIQVPPVTRLVILDYFTRSWAQGRLRPDLYYTDRCFGCCAAWNLHFIDWMGCFKEPTDESDVPDQVTKAHLTACLESEGVPFRRSAKRVDLIQLVRQKPGLLADLIRTHAPEVRVPKEEWKEALQEWSQRVSKVHCIAAAILNTLGTKSIFH